VNADSTCACTAVSFACAPRSPASTPACHAGRLIASCGSPVTGSTTPGVPITNALSMLIATPARRQARSTAERTSSTGSPSPLVSSCACAITRPVTSATAVFTSPCSMYSAAT